MKNKKGITITNPFQKILKESNRKPSKIWVGKGSELHNRLRNRKKNDIEIYWTLNEGKSVVAERFISTLKKKFINTWTQYQKNVYIDKLDDIVNKYNDKYHSTIKTKPADVKSSKHIDSSKEINNKDPKFKIVDIVRILKYKNMFQIGLKKFF